MRTRGGRRAHRVRSEGSFQIVYFKYVQRRAERERRRWYMVEEEQNWCDGHGTSGRKKRTSERYDVAMRVELGV